MFSIGKKGAPSWLIVCLGNPGPKYSGTRHNAGFMAAEALSKELGITVNKLRFKALTGECRIAEQQVLIMMPQTYMNLSGESVSQAAKFYKIPAERIIVISDEMSLPVGKIRIRTKGSAGGHNGLKNIIQELGTEDFPRIRMGIDRPPHPDYDVADWVLSGFKNKDAENIHDAAVRSAKAAVCYISDGAERAMSIYN